MIISRGKWVWASVVLLLLIALMAACSNNNSDSQNNGGNTPNTSTPDTENSSDTEQILPVRYVVPGVAPVDLDKVQAAVNEKLKADGLNLELEVIFIDWDVWDQRTNLMLSTGEEFELLHVMENGVNSGVYAGRGAIIPLDDLIDEHGDVLKEVIDETTFNGAKVDGSIYSIPAMWRSEVGTGAEIGPIGVRADYLAEVNEPIPTTVEDFIRSAEKIQALTDQDTYVHLATNRVPVAFQRTYPEWPFFVDLNDLFFVDQQGNVEAYIETDVFKRDSQILRELYTKNLINPDILSMTNADRNKALDTGNFSFNIGGVVHRYPTMIPNVPDIKVEEFFLAPDEPILQMFAFGNTNAVPVTTKHPEAGVKFLNWLYSSSENHNLFVYGIEGEHWTPEGDRKLNRILDADGKFYAFPDWQIAHTDFTRYSTEDLDYYIQVRTGIADGMTSVEAVNLGFRFDTEPVSVEYTNLIAEIKASIYPIKHGVVEYDKHFPAALANMKAAGLDKVVAEYERQLKEWMAKK